MIYLKGEDILSLIYMPTYEANYQIICVPLLQGASLPNFQGGGGGRLSQPLIRCIQYEISATTI